MKLFYNKGAWQIQIGVKTQLSFTCKGTFCRISPGIDEEDIFYRLSIPNLEKK